jgi:hypothetical protein
MAELLKKVSNASAARAAAGLCTLLAIFLHIVFASQAGALWRDEVNTLEIATMRTWSDMWASLCFDSFPGLFFVLLRGVAGVPATISDAGLRIFGLVIGLVGIGVVWLNARWLRLGVPLLSLALIGFNPMIIRYSDSIRAYGLGLALALLTLGAMWRLLESFTPRNLAMAILTAVLSVQCLYSNSVLLLAICFGAAAVTLRRGRLNQTLAVLMIGGVSAATLLPYLPTIHRVQSWNYVWKAAFTPTVLWQKTSETLGAPLSLGAWVWAALVLVAVGSGTTMLLLRRIKNESLSERKERVLFALVTLVAGSAAYAAFLHVLGYLTQPWYYIVFAAFAATCTEMVFASISEARWLLGGRTILALLLAAGFSYPATQALRARQTNVDLVARRLEGLAGREDLILINPWFYGVSFQHYFHGSASYSTIPPLEDHRSHRADLLVKEMMSPDALAPTLQTMTETLQGGHAIWLVGPVDFLPAGQKPRAIAPATEETKKARTPDFSQMWSEQTGFFLQTHGGHFERVQVSNNKPVSRYENLPLSVIRGWRPEPAPQ